MEHFSEMILHPIKMPPLWGGSEHSGVNKIVACSLNLSCMLFIWLDVCTSEVNQTSFLDLIMRIIMYIFSSILRIYYMYIFFHVKSIADMEGSCEFFRRKCTTLLFYQRTTFK